LPRGKKASTSDKPGETREITFYQLSSSIVSPSNTQSTDNIKDDKHHHSNLKKKPTSNKNQSNNQTMGLILADLPGYGFSFAKDDKVNEWLELMKYYINERGSRTLKRILLLIDARHGFKEADRIFLDALQDHMEDIRRGRTTDSSSTTTTKGNSLADKQLSSEKGGFGRIIELSPIQIVLTKCDLVSRNDLARRVVLVKSELSDLLRREPSSLPIMMVSAKAGIGYNCIKGGRARGGILELQKELASIVPEPTFARKWEKNTTRS